MTVAKINIDNLFTFENLFHSWRKVCNTSQVHCDDLQLCSCKFLQTTLSILDVAFIVEVRRSILKVKFQFSCFNLMKYSKLFIIYLYWDISWEDIFEFFKTVSDFSLLSFFKLVVKFTENHFWRYLKENGKIKNNNNIVLLFKIWKKFGFR